MNKQERTYTVLRDRIHSGAVRPNTRLNIDAIARELGVSAIPVREALRRLEAEGWVRFQPNVGAIVAPVDATTWEQEMTAVAILEGAATADACGRLTPADFGGLRAIAAEMKDAVADPLEFSALNRRLHATITARCANAYLLELLEATYRRLDRIRSTLFAYLPERTSAALAEHAELLTLLEAGDAAAVERYARWHKLQTVESYRALRSADPGGRPPGSPRCAAGETPKYRPRELFAERVRGLAENRERQGDAVGGGAAGQELHGGREVIGERSRRGSCPAPRAGYWRWRG